MKRVIGLGGVFFRCKDPRALSQWYEKHLGLPIQEWGGAVFKWDEMQAAAKGGYNLISFFSADNQYIPSDKAFMLNLVVDDLDALLLKLREEGVEVLPGEQDSEFGKFGWVMDPEGNKVELWQPPA